MTKKKAVEIKELPTTHNGFNITQNKRDFTVTNPVSKTVVVFPKLNHIMEDVLVWCRTQANPLEAV